ncbi:MAG TPA: MFS transporter [archaeon]|nr:MFS transporter [archaeon]
MTAGVFPQRLTLAQKRKAQKGFLYFATINALSYSALAESVLVLFALKLGANDFHVGLLASYIYLTAVFVLLGKIMVSRWGAAKTYSLCWLLRNLAGGLFIFAPWIWSNYSHNLGLFWLLGVSFVFFSLRSMGISADNVLINDVTSEQDRGRFISRLFFFGYVAMLSMLVAVSFWLKGNPAFFHFQVVVGAGSLFGVAASIFLWRVPESEGPSNSSREPMLSALSLVYRERRLQLLLVAWVAAVSAIQLLAPFQVLAVKNGYLISDQGAVVFVVLQTLGLVTASYLDSLLVDRSGPRPVMIINLLGLGILSLLWAISPGEINYIYTGALFYLVGFCMVSVQITLSHYFLNTVRQESLLNLYLLITVLQGMAAGFIGTFLGGGLLEAIRNFGLQRIEIYRTYFLFVLVAQFVALVMALRLKPLAERHIRSVLGMMFSVREWRTLLSVQRLSEIPELGKARQLLDRLASLRSEVSEKTLLEYLDSPLFTIRTTALEALDKIDFGPEAARRLIQEVKTGEFTTAFLAAEILGAHHVEEGMPVLREGLYSNDFFLQGKAMVALAELGDRESFGRIYEIFQHTYNPRLVIHGARAIFHTGDRSNIPLLFKKLDPRMLPSEHDEIMHTVFALSGWSEENFRLMTLYNRDPQQGVDALNDEVETKLQAASGKISSRGELLVKRALDALAAAKDTPPEALIGLLNETAGLPTEKAHYLQSLLADNARLAREAPPRLLFALTILGAFIYLEQFERK